MLGLGREEGHCEYIDGSFLGQFGHLDQEIFKYAYFMTQSYCPTLLAKLRLLGTLNANKYVKKTMLQKGRYCSQRYICLGVMNVFDVPTVSSVLLVLADI